MAARHALRAVPSVLVGALVFAAAAAQTGPDHPFRRLLPSRPLVVQGVEQTVAAVPAPSRPIGALSADDLPACDGPPVSQSITVTADYPLDAGRIVLQPITISGDNFAIGRVTLPRAVTITTVPPDLGIRLVTPGLPPDLTQVLLRDMVRPTCPEPCDLDSWDTGVPIVTRAVTGVAQGGGGWTALQLRSFDDGSGVIATATARYDEASNLPMPRALAFDPNQGFWEQLPGPYAVVAHTVCAPTGTAQIQNLHVAQQLLRADVAITGTSHVLQSFRVPQTVEVSWTELGLRATGAGGGGGGGAGGMAVGLMAPAVCTCTANPFPGNYSLGVGDVPPSVVNTATVTSALRPATAFTTPVTLTPGVDYWIVVPTPTADWDFAAGSASDYTDGRLWVGFGSGLPTTELDDVDLAFRLIGVPRPLLAGPITHTCDPCFDAFTAVTTTADFGTLDQPRAFATVLPVTSTPIVDVSVALAADGGHPTLTAEVGFAGVDAQGLGVPSSESFPLARVVVTATAGLARFAEIALDRPLVFEPAVTPTAQLLGLVLSPPAGEPAGRAKVALGDEAVCTCTAILTSVAGGSWQPMPGLALGRGVQTSTMTAEVSLREIVAERTTKGSTLTAEIVQSFRVPVATTVDWIELAIPAGGAGAMPLEFAIFEPADPVTPTADFVHPTPTATLPVRAGMALGSTWGATNLVLAPNTLQPGKDYALALKLTNGWQVAAAATPTAQTTGRLWTRPFGNGPWAEQPGALSFRIIGTPQQTNAVDPTPGRLAFALAADPQPFSRELSLRWSGGAGRTRIDIFDAGGRRVRHVPDAGEAAAGLWRWRGEDDDGRRVAPGVYFARVTPSSGDAVRRRVVFVP
jgi:hypothetical protein